MKRKKKTLWGRAYAVGYRYVSKADKIQNSKAHKFNIIMPSWKFGYADPFPFVYHNKHYIFVEIMEKISERGTIGVCCIEDGNKVHEIIREDFHLSYPNVFEWRGNIYMIPESHESKQIRLYKAEVFPDQWVLDRVLFEGLDVVDFSFYITGKYLYGIAFDIEKGGKNRYFKCDLESKNMTELFPTLDCVIEKRPGGNFFYDGDALYLPVQECGTCYGEYLHFLRVYEFSDAVINEEEVFQITANDVKANRLLKFDRVHTYNRYDDFETIDLFLYQVSLKKIWYVLTNKIESRHSAGN